jgi:hypothetical protein
MRIPPVVIEVLECIFSVDRDKGSAEIHHVDLIVPVAVTLKGEL